MIFCACCFAVLALAGAYVLNAHANSSGCVRCSSSGIHTSSSNTTAVTVVQRLTQVTTTITTATTTIITMSDGSTNSKTSSTTRTTNHTIKPLSSTNLDPVPCGGGEKRYHSWMSMGYAFITAIGLLLGLTSRMREVKKNDRMVVNMEFQFVVLVCIPGLAFLIFSGSFLSSCSSQDLTMYMPRSITFGTLGTLLLILAAGLQFSDSGLASSRWLKACKCLMECCQNSDQLHRTNSNKVQHKLARWRFAVTVIWLWTVVALLEVALSIVNYHQAADRYLGTDAFPSIPESEQCHDPEMKMYGAFIVAALLVNFAMAAIRRSVSISVDFETNKQAVLQKQLILQGLNWIATPCHIFCLICIMSLFTCRAIGHDVLFQFAIGVTAFFILVVSYMLHVRGHCSRLTQEVEAADDFTNRAIDIASSIESEDKTIRFTPSDMDSAPGVIDDTTSTGAASHSTTGSGTGNGADTTEKERVESSADLEAPPAPASSTPESPPPADGNLWTLIDPRDFAMFVNLTAYGIVCVVVYVIA